MTTSLLLILFALVIQIEAEEETGNHAEQLLFQEHVAPLLAAHCLECHAGDRPEGGLNLTRRETMLSGGDSGPAIVTFDPGKSLLWQRVEQEEMPPEDPLSEQDRSVLRRWIASGAGWDGGPIDPFRYTTDHRAAYDWWSLQPLRDVAPPEVVQRDWPRGEIDRFVLHRLELHGLSPSDQAEPRVLIRRLYYDLLGLPPPPEEVAAFVADPTDAAYVALVDRLLASPHYGERWGRHWLDVARFGESDGFERNNPRMNFWHYRDWVIGALNRDMPYDRFVRMQLAGDILDGGLDGAAAAGFLVAGVHNTVVGSSERMKRLARQDELEEIIATVGQTFLGLTVNCGRCHDHKFDPISSREYYQLIAAIDGVSHGEREIVAGDVAEQPATLDEEITDLQTALRDIDIRARRAIREQRRAQGDVEPSIDAPRPFARWEFDEDLRDDIGNLHGTAAGRAHLADGALVLDGRDSYVRTAPLHRDLQEKTLAAWLMLDDLDQRGGGVISVETEDGVAFDAIVFGEREPKRWMAGSNNFARTQSFQGDEELAADEEPVHIAITYQRDGTITAYRNGVPYGQSYQTGFVSFPAGKSHVVFGLRHLPAGGNRLLSGRILQASLYDRALDAEAVAAAAGIENDYVSEEAIIDSLTDAARRQRRRLKGQLALAETRRTELNDLARTKVYTVVPHRPDAMQVHVRGSVTDFGDPVSPGGLRAVSGADPDFGLPPDAPDSQRRMKLAQWITESSNPIFARVIVNRMWHYHFGTGIVDTPNDLGFGGGRPTHPDLLDWLAGQLRRDNFHLKPLHRRIVLSATYRQASTLRRDARNQDAANRLLWRYAPRRVEAEVLRDAMLQVAGVLNTQRGGPGFQDVTVTPNSGTTYYEAIDRDETDYQRRTVYRFAPRGGRSPLLDTFDCPDPSATAPRRSVTTTPLQALSLMNNAFVLRVSERFAERVQREAGKNVDSQIRRAWQLALGREPDGEELRLAESLVAEYGLPTLCRALFNVNEFVVIE